MDPTARSLRRIILNKIRANLITSVIAALVLTWFVTSWFVYKAEVQATGANITSYTESIWWGIVTLLTVGYGDRYPVTTEGRVWAGVLMFSGVFAVAIVTS